MLTDFSLLKNLCAIHSPSGEEWRMKEFLINYIQNEQSSWKNTPQLFYGEEFQDCLILVFGKPRTAVFAHMDSVGYTVRYGNELVRIGKPMANSGTKLCGEDSRGKIDCKLTIKKDGALRYKFSRVIERGTSLIYKNDFRETNESIQSCYLDNRLGIWSALNVARNLKDGIIVFSAWEESGGGSVGFLSKFIYEKFNITQALISDITWVTDGVHAGKGVAISMRDSGIPRKTFINKIIKIAENGKIPFQIEVESTGGSDGNYIQQAPYPINWCFVGAPENFVHTPDEKVHKLDIIAMVDLYELLMLNL